MQASCLPQVRRWRPPPRASECECCLEWGPEKRWLVTAGPWAPSPEAGGRALILGFTWKMAEPTPLPRTRCWWAGMPVCSTSTGQQVQGGSGDDQALPPTRSARPAAPLPERRRLWEGSRRRRVGGGQAHFCWVHSSPHWGPLHTLLCGLHLSWDAGGVGRSPSVPHHPWLPCPLPTRPSTAPRVSSSGRAICFLLGLDEQPRRPRSGRCQPLSPLDSLAQAAWKPLPGGRRGQSGWASGSGTPLGSPGTPRPPPTGRASGPALRGHNGPAAASGDTRDPRQAGWALQLNTCLHPSREESGLPWAGRGLGWAGGHGRAPAGPRVPSAHHEGCPRDRES